MCCNTVSRLFIDQLFRCGDLSENVSSCSVCSLDHCIIFGQIVIKKKKKSLKCRYAFCLFSVSPCSLTAGRPEYFPTFQSYSGSDVKGAYSALLVKFSIPEGLYKACFLLNFHLDCVRSFVLHRLCVPAEDNA